MFLVGAVLEVEGFGFVVVVGLGLYCSWVSGVLLCRVACLFVGLVLFVNRWGVSCLFLLFCWVGSGAVNYYAWPGLFCVCCICLFFDFRILRWGCVGVGAAFMFCLFCKFGVWGCVYVV